MTLWSPDGALLEGNISTILKQVVSFQRNLHLFIKWIGLHFSICNVAESGTLFSRAWIYILVGAEDKLWDESTLRLWCLIYWFEISLTKHNCSFSLKRTAPHKLQTVCFTPNPPRSVYFFSNFTSLNDRHTVLSVRIYPFVIFTLSAYTRVVKRERGMLVR